MSTHKVSVRRARGSLRRLLDQIQAGEVVVLRRGVEGVLKQLQVSGVSLPRR